MKINEITDCPVAGYPEEYNIWNPEMCAML